MKAKTSKGLFAAVLSKLDEEKDDVSDVQQQPRSASPHLMKVAAGVKEMQERSKLADELLRTGSQIVEINPDKIKQSAIKDRLDSNLDDATIAELEASMRERGQIVPGLVRPIAGTNDEFEIVYGRRRLAVAKRLGIAFKAAIRALSDEEAIIFQGEENTARNDLSFIEKCLFAKAQEDAGFKREVICASLSTGKSHISEMIKLARLLPPPLLDIIGKAPSIGRGRWEELTNVLAALPNNDLTTELQLIIGKDGGDKQQFNALSSDDRFARIYDGFVTNNTLNREKSVPKPHKKSSSNRVKNTKGQHQNKWQSPDQNLEITMIKSSGNAVFTIHPIEKSINHQNTADHGAPNNPTLESATTIEAFTNFDDFADFLSSNFDALYSAYQRAAKTTKKGDE
ncbi:plasmid partitioning protein RepB [Bartonella sp. HY038]|uniref:plasmid partitioning protein RepB n=1 Tax=Bartonella sp. HY038 TaxID=2759660 RepID=UPI0015FB792F|nr:plasmid partitioning protein RepB [Bartonella sp. HY038]